MKQKYIFTDKFIVNDSGIKMFQIKCVSPFANVSEGELGGYIEKECNLSQDGNAWVYGNARVYGDAQVYGNAEVSGNAQVYGNARVYGDADINSNDKHCGFDCFGSQNMHTHAYMTKQGTVEITCGCFQGKLDEFVKKVESTHAGTVYEKQYKAIAELIRIKFNLD